MEAKKSMTHLDNLLAKIPDLLKRRMLDVGAGRGDFVKEVRSRGGQIQGIEIDPERARAAEVLTGVAENMPFEDKSFDFINLAEVIEHVQDPTKVLLEIKRLLAPEGICYISVPSRFSLKDPHYHLYFINWMPRSWSSFILSHTKILRPVKYDRQSLGEMNYYTYRNFANLCQDLGLDYKDSRPVSGLLLWPYKLTRWLLPAHHFFLSSSSI